MRKACFLLLLFVVRPGHAQSGGEPELMPGFKSRPKKAPKAGPLREPSRPAENKTREAGARPTSKPPSAPDDMMRKPVPKTLGAKAERRPRLSFRTRAWWFSGSMDTRVSEQVPPGQTSPPGSEVWLGLTEERGAEGFMFVHSAELAPFSWLGLTAEYGKTTRLRGAGRERWWVHAPQADRLIYVPTGGSWSRPEHEDDQVFSLKTAGEAEWAAANLYWRIVEARIAGQDDDEFRHALDVGGGYQRLRLRQRLSERSLALKRGKLYNLPLNAGLDGTYHAQWQGAHAALRDTVKFPAGFVAEGEAFWAPVGMEFRGDGYDNTQAGPGGLAAATPNYRDRARGSAIHFRFSGGWSWGPFSLEGGWQRLYFYSRTGKRRWHLFGGGDRDEALEFGVTSLSGLFVGGALRF